MTKALKTNFSIGKEFKHLVTVEGGSYYITLVDLDKDGIPEIDFLDGAIDYIFASFAFSPPARVILKYINGKYEVAKKLMLKPYLTFNEIQMEKSKIAKGFKDQDSPDLPYDFLQLMMELSYTGHMKEALELASETWPTSKDGLEKFKEEFQEQLSYSQYWKSFYNQLLDKDFVKDPLLVK